VVDVGRLPLPPSWKLTMLTAPAMTLLFLGVVFSLGAAFMWMFWEVEQMKQRRHRGRFSARGPHQNGPR
jgi:hypothetical protein